MLSGWEGKRSLSGVEKRGGGRKGCSAGQKEGRWKKVVHGVRTQNKEDMTKVKYRATDAYGD